MNAKDVFHVVNQKESIKLILLIFTELVSLKCLQLHSLRNNRRHGVTLTTQGAFELMISITCQDLLDQRIKD